MLSFSDGCARRCQPASLLHSGTEQLVFQAPDLARTFFPRGIAPAVRPCAYLQGANRRMLSDGLPPSSGAARAAVLVGSGTTMWPRAACWRRPTRRRACACWAVPVRCLPRRTWLRGDACRRRWAARPRSAGGGWSSSRRRGPTQAAASPAPCLSACPWRLPRVCVTCRAPQAPLLPSCHSLEVPAALSS